MYTRVIAAVVVRENRNEQTHTNEYCTLHDEPNVASIWKLHAIQDRLPADQSAPREREEEEREREREKKGKENTDWRTKTGGKQD